jgi:NAD(P)-dependent dehydrogenase (short-subunit alcohol dehydrogenase family)
VRRVAVVTGASSGIGREAAIELARRDWALAVVGRDRQRTNEVASVVGGEPFVADFDDLEQVASLSEKVLSRYGSINALVNNAGGIVATRQPSVDGYELTWQRNVLAPVLLTEKLAPALVASGGRVVHTTSMIHRSASLRLDDLNWETRRFGAGWRAYAEAKLGVVLYARYVAKHWGLDSFPVHPGYVATGFGPGTTSSKAVLWATRGLQISVASGAAPLVHLVDTPELGVPSGTYFDGLIPLGKEHPLAKAPDTITRYVTECFARVGLGDTVSPTTAKENA